MFTCEDETNSTGAAMPFTAAETPPSEYGLGLAVVASAVVFARFLPKMDISIPGAPFPVVENELLTDVMPIPDVAPPRTKITGTVIDCGIAFGDWMTTSARYAPGP